MSPRKQSAGKGKPDEIFIPDKLYFRIGEVARLCHVSLRNVVRWIDSGKLLGQISPGGKHRFVPRESVARFLKEALLRVEGFEAEA